MICETACGLYRYTNHLPVLDWNLKVSTNIYPIYLFIIRFVYLNIPLFTYRGEINVDANN
jgi:hypothetical protein